MPGKQRLKRDAGIQALRKVMAGKYYSPEGDILPDLIPGVYL